MIPTAEKLLEEHFISVDKSNIKSGHYFAIKEAMKDFAKLHVEAALQAAIENATVTPIDHEEISEGSFRPIWGVDDDSILNAYSLENIK